MSTISPATPPSPTSPTSSTSPTAAPPSMPPPERRDGTAGPHDREPGWALLFHAVAGGPVIWAIHLSASAALVHTACAHDMAWVINLVTGVSALIAASCIASAWYIRRSLVSAVGAYNGRTRGLMFLGLLFGTVSLMLILLEGAPVWFLNACKVA